MPILLGLYLLANIASYGIFAIDKWKAKNNKWRISESALLSFAFFGGIGAYLSMQQYRHKTKKKKFTVTIPVFICLQILLLIFLFIK